MGAHGLRLRLRAATSNAILDAAEQVAAEGGSSNASLQAIAERAGIAVGTIYNYFEDREKLFDALVARRSEELFDAIDASARKHAHDRFEAQLDAFVRTVLGHFDGRRAYLRIALEGELPVTKALPSKDGKRRPAMQQLQERARRIMRVGARESKLRDESSDLLATVLVSIVRGVLVVRARDSQAFSPETEHVLKLFLHGAAR
jgi:AcrR family transcriptional regulator